VLVELDEFGVVALVVVFVVVSFSFVFSVVGFTTVVLFSTFLSGAGEVVVGATTVLSSQPPRSAALAKINSSFFIGFWIGCPSWDKPESNRAKFSVLPKYEFYRQLRD
jgi:membrane protein DedA with SNARE-associated domain